jgi:CRISPR type I-E-associated protein CasB/Cse2
MADHDNATNRKRDLAQDVASVAGTLAHKEFPKGDLADLRRGGTRLTTSPGYWRVLLDRVSEERRRNVEQERLWGVVMQCMAVMAPNIHAPGRTLGKVLAQTGRDSLEHRFLRLLRSQGSALEDQMRLMARFLASQNLAVDWAPLAGLLLARSEAARETIRRRLARDYYGTSLPSEETTNA